MFYVFQGPWNTGVAPFIWGRNMVLIHSLNLNPTTQQALPWADKAETWNHCLKNLANMPLKENIDSIPNLPYLETKSVKSCTVLEQYWKKSCGQHTFRPIKYHQNYENSFENMSYFSGEKQLLKVKTVFLPLLKQNNFGFRLTVASAFIFSFVWVWFCFIGLRGFFGGVGFFVFVFHISHIFSNEIF